MFLCFKLGMPANNAYNGKWTGEGIFYAIIEEVRGKEKLAKARQILDKGYYTYSFGDGWVASVTVTEVSASEATELRNKSKGFHSYDWMVEAIWKYGSIRSKPNAK